ncbi:hypothetical protein [Azohydromonas sp.]|uniref:hypothetical protein n=1 Tax=Azohydromonas sp. TaxID=1872666 RepID=UPI002CC7F52C|nr:hypothetical protein [Azohydromonas sp.]HMM85343.1 hypothetical protein [Azohydromonas sp.]
MTDLADLEHVVRRVIRQELERLFADRLTPPQRRTMQIIIAMFEAGECFTTAGVVDAARFDPEAKKVLLQTCNLDPHKLGILLGQVAQAGAAVDGLRLVRLPAEAGSRRWVLEAVQTL